MLRILKCLTTEQDPWLVGLALLLALFASYTALTAIQQSRAASGVQRTAWWLLASVVAGTGIWATHFADTNAYMDNAVGANPWMAFASYGAAVAVSAVGLALVRDSGRVGGLAGGVVIGLGLATAHYMHIYALGIAGGVLLYDPTCIVTSLVLGISLCGLAGSLLGTTRSSRSTIAAASFLSVGIVSLHFVSMCGVRIVRGADLGAATGWQATDLKTYVILAAFGLLAVASSVSRYDRRLARLASADNERLNAIAAALSESEERYRIASRVTNDVIWEWDHRTDRIKWGEGVSRVFGYRHGLEETPHSWWESRVHPDDLKHAMQVRLGAMGGPALTWSQEFRFRRADGEYAHVACRAHVIRDAGGKAIRSIGAMLDISDQKKVEDTLRVAALHDPLTGLANRALFRERLDASLEAASAGGAPIGLMLIDVDHFKSLNDSFGHHAGDRVLRRVAAHLTERAPDDATVARLGGDEFAVLLPALTAGSLGNIAEYLLADIDRPFFVDDQAVVTTVSAGAAKWPHDGETAVDLLKSADLALYAAKGEGRNLIRTFDSEMRQVAQRRSSMLSEARSALDSDRIIPFYQPKVELATGRIVGFEALLRLHHHRFGLQPPSTISAAFQDHEISRRITDRMLDSVLWDIRRWQDEGVAFGRIAINAAPGDFLRGEFADRLLSKANAVGVALSSLEIEITETVFLDQTDGIVARHLREISAAGATIALDDFGTGYASLSHLKKFPVDVMKIDGSFVADLESDDDHGRLIIGAIVGLAKNLKIETVAEGVESAAQARTLLSRGCQIAQGYLFSRAVAMSHVQRVIDRAAAGDFDLGNLDAQARGSALGTEA